MKQRLSGKRRAGAMTMKIPDGDSDGHDGSAGTIFLIIYVLSKGLPNLSWQLLFHCAQLPERDHRYLAGYSEYPVYCAGDHSHRGAAGCRGGNLPDRICRGELHSGGDRIRG